MADTLFDTAPYFERFEWPEDDPDGSPGFVCNGCGRDVTSEPCPDHAPQAVPGLRLVECEATPRHWIWVHDRDDYGAGCMRCWLNEQAEERLKAEACRHWAWRRWKLTHWLTTKAYTLGITSGGGGAVWGNGHNWCLSSIPRFNFHPRPYVLGIKREVWRCWLIGHHRRGEDVGFGFCGKCVPWPCCGSQLVAHVKGCVEDV